VDAARFAKLLFWDKVMGLSRRYIPLIQLVHEWRRRLEPKPRLLVRHPLESLYSGTLDSLRESLSICIRGRLL
jgi:hypothetical protein